MLEHAARNAIFIINAPGLTEHYVALYKLSTDPIPESWGRSEADVVIRYFWITTTLTTF